MSESTALTVTEGEFREVAPVVGRALNPVQVPDFYTIIPTPPGWTRLKKSKNPDGTVEETEVNYYVDTKIFQQPTPKHEKKRHFKGYPYTTADYARKQLNKAFDFGRWSWHESEARVGREYKLLVGKPPEPKTYKEMIVVGYILAPGYPPMKGEGSAPWAIEDTNDPRFSEVTAKKAAASLALKDAAKRGFGIGADVNEDDATLQVILGTQTTCVNMFGQLIKMGADKKKHALAIAARYAPYALAGETLSAEGIPEDTMDQFLSELTKEVMAK